MKIIRSAFVVIGSFVPFVIVGCMLGHLSLALFVWPIFATVGIYQVCKEPKREALAKKGVNYEV